ILLGFIVADCGGSRDTASGEDPVSLESVVSACRSAEREGGREIGDPLTFTLSPELAARAAPTMPMENDTRRGRMLTGEVHDTYAAALGGIAGHAGLFGTAPAVGAFARMMLRAARGDASVPAPFNPAVVTRFVTRSSA